MDGPGSRRRQAHPGIITKDTTRGQNVQWSELLSGEPKAAKKGSSLLGAYCELGLCSYP